MMPTSCFTGAEVVQLGHLATSFCPDTRFDVMENTSREELAKNDVCNILSIKQKGYLATDFQIFIKQPSSLALQAH